MSQQLIVLAAISGLLGHMEIIPICHSGGQEVCHVVKCLVAKNSVKKDQGLGVGTVHKRHKECY